MRPAPSSWLKYIGPGFVVAATGVGAGDLIAASVAGARYGTIILWAALLGGFLKFVLNEGIARWQLATGSTLLEGWITKLPRIISLYFYIVSHALVLCSSRSTDFLLRPCCSQPAAFRQ